MRIWGIKFKVNLLFLAVIAIAVYGHYFTQIALLFTIVLLHEIAHVVAARVYGYRVESIELLPFGGVAKLASSELGWNAKHETLIAICGPLMNLLLSLLAECLYLLHLISANDATNFVSMNMTIAIFNLLPALPLDGGRIARAALAVHYGYEWSTRLVTRLAYYLSAALMILGLLSLWLGYADLGLLALGVFLLFSAFTLSKQSRYDTLRFLDSKRKMKKRAAEPLRALVVDPEMAIGDVAVQFAPGTYHVVYIRDERLYDDRRGVFAKTLNEEQILSAIFERGLWREPIFQLLS
ncbi:M50 family metallopeptidase [Sulfoacidibacillus thermotolerans]|uniref:Peptidase M50 domain-containing protein n=1 Tax=Sulfoacidibacillus thermotolerans TaxID=1765684 RepID=A0A2U3DC13_SULT2|nr:M50 family metallopeptidase [Sulfoacidibacillus thermotolerans]PWI58820.1 hypothetical protein BM613_01635 [Sulfoacidibacillus thermotolerans]